MISAEKESKFRMYFRQELEELLTDPNAPYSAEEAERYMYLFNKNGKIWRDRMIDDLLCRCGDDLRLSRDEIEELRKTILTVHPLMV